LTYFNYSDSAQRSTMALVAKWWAEALARGVKNPEAWVAKRCAAEIKEAIEREKNLIQAGKEEGRGEMDANSLSFLEQ
jgi:hypothetical protein